jgi:serine protease Do
MLKNWLRPELGILWMLFFCQISYAQLPDFTVMAEENGAAVVNISTVQKEPEPREKLENQEMPQIPEGTPFDELFKHFFQGPGGEYVPRDTKSLGSGFIISSDGYLLTNHHVVRDAAEIIVKLTDRRELMAELVGSDPRTDVALLKIKGENFPVVDIGSSKKLRVGEWVLAIGTPFGFDHSVTAGIVSAKGRSLPGDNYVPFIQTDVAINPGNSGGPLFNMDGKVVGMNSQIYSRSGGYMGLSFAIPMDVVMNVVEQIKSHGKVERGWLGGQIQDVTRELAESFAMKRPYGALVAKVIAGSPAEKGGLKIGDIIVEFNGQKIESSSELPPIVGMTPINKKSSVEIIRQGSNKTIFVTIGLLKEHEELQIAPDKSPGKPVNRIGLSVSDLNTEQREQFQVAKGGALVLQVQKGAAQDAGILQGDVILRVQNSVINNAADLEKVIDKLPEGKSIAVLVQRYGSPMFLAIKLKKP